MSKKPNAKSAPRIVAPTPTDLEREIFLEYWQLQHERVKAHEDSRYQVTSFVLAGSLVALGFVAGDASSDAARRLAGAGVAAINVLAVVFISGERRWIKVHQHRADAVLRSLAPGLMKTQAEVNKRWDLKSRGDLRNSLLRSSLVLSYMHVILVGVASWLAFT